MANVWVSLTVVPGYGPDPVTRRAELATACTGAGSYRTMFQQTVEHTDTAEYVSLDDPVFLDDRWDTTPLTLAGCLIIVQAPLPPHP